jgi:ketosteroid isomerase-like protein
MITTEVPPAAVALPLPIAMGEKSVNPNWAFLEAFTAAFTSDDIVGWSGLAAPDAVWEVVASGETFTGKAKLLELANRSVAARVHSGDTGIKPFNIFSNPDGSRVCWEYVHTAIVTDKWPASERRPAVGSSVNIPIVLIMEIRDGKFVKVREYFDLLTASGDPRGAHPLYS